MKTLFRLAVAIGVVVLLIWTCGFQVAPNETVIVARFGSPRQVVTDAGLHWKAPAPIDTAIRIDRRLHVLDAPSGEFLTSDKKNVIVGVFLCWRVADAQRFFVTLNNRASAEARLTDLLRSVTGNELSSRPFSALASPKTGEAVMAEIDDRLTQVAAERALPSFGIEVAAVRIKRLNFPSQNKEAVFRRMEAERDSIAAGYRSEGNENYARVKADTNREEARLRAEAERKAEELRGEADAEATRIYAEAYAKDPAFYEFKRSLETLESVLGGNSTWVIPSDHELLKALSAAGIPIVPEKNATGAATDGGPHKQGG